MKFFQPCKFAQLATIAALMSVSLVSAAAQGSAGNPSAAASNIDHQLMYKSMSGAAAGAASGQNDYKMMVDDYGKAASEYNKVVDYTKGGVEYGQGVDAAAYKQQQAQQGGQQQLLDSDDGYHHKHDDKGYHHQPYGFGYNIEDGYGNKQWRHEKSANPHHVTGSYGFKDKNGIMREVEYVADKHGFRAIIKTNEPGTASKDPAYVKMHAEPIHVEYYPKEGYHGKHGHGHYAAASSQPEGTHYPAAAPASGAAGSAAAASSPVPYGGGSYQIKKEMKYEDPVLVGGNDSYENEYSASTSTKYTHPNPKDNGVSSINNGNGKFAVKK